MKSPAGALAWAFWRRHRWGWAAIAGYLLVMVGIHAWAFAAGHTLTVDDDETFGLLVMFPLSATILYAITVFTFATSGDLAARESLFPARYLRLPMTTRALTWWPMCFGAVTMLFLWSATRSLLILPPHVTVPVVWPAFLGVAILGWAQAATWMPYGLRGIRVVVTVFWLVMIDAVVILAVYLKAPEWMMVALLAPQVPIAWVVAQKAVARARRGDTPDWSRNRAATLTGGGATAPFESAHHAQRWYEWRHHGLNLPALVALVVPVELALFFTTGGAASLVFLIIAGVVVTPPFLAMFAGATLSRSNPRDGGLPPFLATRPMSSASLVAAKLRVTVASTLVTWIFVGIATPIAMMLSGTWIIITDIMSRSWTTFGAPRAIAIPAIVLGILVLSTWRLLVQSLYIGLTGREWLVKGMAFAMLFVVFLLVPLASWAWRNNAALRFLWKAIPLTLAFLVALKLVAAVLVMQGLWDRGVLTDRALVAIAAGWCAGALGLFGVFHWFWGMPYLPRYILAMLAILIVPFARVAAAPLAFDWNRHR